MIDTLKNAPPEAWLALFGVLLGSLLTTLGVWLTNRANAKQQKWQLAHDKELYRQKVKKEKLEELYVMAGHWLSGILSNYMVLSYVMKDELDYNQYLDQTINNKPSSAYDFRRLEMLLDMYGNEVMDKYQSVINAREVANKIMLDHKIAYKNGESGKRFLKPFLEAQESLDREGELLKKAIANVATNA